MGFWHTGYIEHHEQTGIEEWLRPGPTTYKCSKCGAIFEHSSALRYHRFEKHPLKRPILLIGGIEVGNTPISITRPIKSADVDTAACETAIVNGKKIPADQLGDTLAIIEHDTTKVSLQGEGITTSFVLRIDISLEEDLLGVETAFSKLARLRKLDSYAIENFIANTKQFKTAAVYVDGICEHLYGVLAKERSTDSTLPHEAYREKFNRANEQLVGFDRPLADRIRSIIEFHFNNFRDAAARLPTSRVGIAAEAFLNYIHGPGVENQDPKPITPVDHLDSLLTDWDTEILIRWALEEPSALVEERPHIEKTLLREPPEYDQTKLHVLLAQIGLKTKNEELVRNHAGPLRNNPTLARWARESIASSRTWN